MDLNQRFGMAASFQVVPEDRYEVSDKYLDSIRQRGFEVNVQDLNHDGRLYNHRDEFARRAVKINEYGRRWGLPDSGPRSCTTGRSGTPTLTSLTTCRSHLGASGAATRRMLHGHALLCR